MFPDKIQNFVSTLLLKTQNGELTWIYNDDNSSVQLQTIDFYATLRYNFNEIHEYGEFSLIYIDLKDNKEYRFYTNEEWRDYDLARRLFDVAQSSGLELPF